MAFTYVTPVLAGFQLPDPSHVDEKIEYRGGTAIMADGKAIFDLVQPTAKKTFTYRWNLVTDITNIIGGWDAAKSVNVSLVHVDGATYSVTRSPQSPNVTYRLIYTAEGISYLNVVLEMREN